MKTAAVLAAILSVYLALPARAQDAPPPSNDPPSLRCEPQDADDDSCDEKATESPDGPMSPLNECCSSCVHHSSGQTCVLFLHCNVTC